jgi:hypothetical protein
MGPHIENGVPIFDPFPSSAGTRPVLDYKVALRVRRTFMEVTQAGWLIAEKPPHLKRVSGTFVV